MYVHVSEKQKTNTLGGGEPPPNPPTLFFYLFELLKKKRGSGGFIPQGFVFLPEGHHLSEPFNHTTHGMAGAGQR